MPSIGEIISTVKAVRSKTKGLLDHPVSKKIGKGFGILGAGIYGLDATLSAYERIAPGSTVSRTPKGRKLKNLALLRSLAEAGKSGAGISWATTAAEIAPGGPVIKGLAGIAGYTLGSSLAGIAVDPYLNMREAESEADESRLRFVLEHGMTPEESRRRYEEEQRRKRRRRLR